MIAFAFWLFAVTAIASGVMVISARNPVHSVLWLILAFFSAAGLFVLMGAEFLAMLLIIVYVGAVAVLFLFVVMMLNVNFIALREGFLQYLPIGGLIGLILLAELITLGATWQTSDLAVQSLAAVSNGAVVSNGNEVHNTQALGQVLYTDYFYIFQVSGLILLVAMIGAIVLTHRTREGVKRQNISKQNARKPSEAFALVDVETGDGVAPTAIETAVHSKERSDK